MQWTWANNWGDEGYIEARLDRFFGAPLWFLENNSVTVLHVERQTSDHNLLVLDTNPNQRKRRPRFYFDKIWLQKLGIDVLIRQVWNADCEGSFMHKVPMKIKRCHVELLKWSRQVQGIELGRYESVKGI